MRAAVWLGRVLWRTGVRAGRRLRFAWLSGPFGPRAELGDTMGGPVDDLTLESSAELGGKLERARRAFKRGA